MINPTYVSAIHEHLFNELYLIDFYYYYCSKYSKIFYTRIVIIFKIITFSEMAANYIDCINKVVYTILCIKTHN